MAVKSIIEGITEYFLQCPLLQDGIFRVDALGQDAVEYVIETGICDPIIQRYVDGSTERQYQFQFGSREYYSMDRLQNIENSQFYERLADWIGKIAYLGTFRKCQRECRQRKSRCCHPDISMMEQWKTQGTR